MSEDDIERFAREDLGDLPDDFWDDAVLVTPPPKRGIFLRIDEDIIDWFRSAGPRYQTRMNAVLRSYMERAGNTVRPAPPAPAKRKRGRKTRG